MVSCAKRRKKGVAETPYSFQQGLLQIPPKRDPERRLVLLPIGAILPNPAQPRRAFDRAALSELMVSIAQIGLIQPLTVRRSGDGYELISGERRLRACRALGYSEVPCIIADASEERSAYMALVENIQRSDLHFLDEAESYHNLLHTYDLSQEQLATRLGKSQSFLSNKLRLLKLPKAMRARIREANLSERRLPSVYEQRKNLSRTVGRKRDENRDGGAAPQRRIRSCDPRPLPRADAVLIGKAASFPRFGCTSCENSTHG